MATEAVRPVAHHQPWYKILYLQVLIAIALGVLVGRFFPDLGKELALAEFDRRLKAVDAAIATVKYTDPGMAAALTGFAAQPEASDIGLSFTAWVNARGGPDAVKLPKEIAAVFTALGKAGKPNANQAKQLRDYFLRSVCVTTADILDPLLKSKDAVTAERTKLDQSIPASMIFRDAPTLSAEAHREMRAFKTLMHPNLMGFSFKALCLEKGVESHAPLAGFSFARNETLRSWP